MSLDDPSRLDRADGFGVNPQVGVRDQRGGEGTRGAQAPVENDVGEFAELAALGGAEPGLDGLLAEGQTHRMERHAPAGQLGEEPVDESPGNRVLGIEGEDDPRTGGAGIDGEIGAPGAVAPGHEARRAEGVLLQHLVHHEVVVMQLVAGERGEFAPDGIFAGGGSAVDEDEIHGVGQVFDLTRRWAGQ